MARARSLAEEEKRLRKKQEEEREALRAKQREEQLKQEEQRRQEQEKLLKLREEFIEKTKKATQFNEMPAEKPEKGKKVICRILLLKKTNLFNSLRFDILGSKEEGRRRRVCYGWIWCGWQRQRGRC